MKTTNHSSLKSTELFKRCNYIFQVLILGLGLLACKKESSPPTPPEIIINLDKRGLEYVNMQTGKYFIYKDSTSGELDSVVVTQSSLGTVHVPGGSNTGIPGYSPAYTYQSLNIVLRKLTPLPAEEWFYGITADMYSPLPITTDTAEIYMLERDNTGVFSYPSQGYSNPVLIPSLTVAGKTYTDVLQFTDYNGYDINDPRFKNRVYYWSKNIGIIKRVTNSMGGVSTVSDLVRNN